MTTILSRARRRLLVALAVTVSMAGCKQEQYEDIGHLFRKSGLVSSPKEQQARFIYGVAQDL